MDLYGMHQGHAQANAVSGEQAAYNQGVSDDNIQSLKNLKARQGTEIEEDDIKDVKDAVSSGVTGYTVQKSAKGYKEAQALKQGKSAAKGIFGGSLAGHDTKPMMKVLSSKKFSPEELRAGSGGAVGKRVQFLQDDMDSMMQRAHALGGGGEGETPSNHGTTNTDTTTLKPEADTKPSSSTGKAVGEVGKIEEGGEEAKTGMGGMIKKATGVGGKIADGLGKIGGGIASAGILGNEIYGEVESFKNHPGGSFYSKLSGDNWEQKVGNVSQEIGTTMDIIGTFVPGAQVLGLVGVGVSAIGGLLDDIGDSVQHHKKEEQTAAQVRDPSKAGITAPMITATPMASAGEIAQAHKSTLRQVSGQS